MNGMHGTPRYRIDGNRIITQAGEIQLPSPIVQLLDYEEHLIARIEVLKQTTCNENIWIIRLPSPSLPHWDKWEIPAPQHATNSCPYTNISMRSNIAVCTGYDEHIVELCGSHPDDVLVDYPRAGGAPYLVDREAITFNSGITVNFGETVVHTLQFGEDVAVRTYSEDLNNPRNLWIVKRTGQDAWQVPFATPPMITEPFLHMVRVNEMIQARAGHGRIIQIDPHTRTVVHEEVDQY